MIIRLAVIGAALTIGGLLNVGGLAAYSIPTGIACLAVTAVAWFVQSRKRRS